MGTENLCLCKNSPRVCFQPDADDLTLSSVTLTLTCGSAVDKSTFGRRPRSGAQVDIFFLLAGLDWAVEEEGCLERRGPPKRVSPFVA